MSEKSELFKSIINTVCTNIKITIESFTPIHHDYIDQSSRTWGFGAARQTSMKRRPRGAIPIPSKLQPQAERTFSIQWPSFDPMRSRNHLANQRVWPHERHHGHHKFKTVNLCCYLVKSARKKFVSQRYFDGNSTLFMMKMQFFYIFYNRRAVHMFKAPCFTKKKC